MCADFFSICCSKRTFLLHLPCPVPWEAGLYELPPTVSFVLWLPAFGCWEAQPEVRKRMRERGPVSLAGSLPGRSRSVGCIHPCLSRGCNYAWVLGTALCLHPFRPVVKAFEKPSSVASPWGPRHPSWVSLTLTIRACFSRVQRFATSWTIACQAPLSMGFSRQECWRGLPFSSPGDLLDPGIKPASLVSLALTGGFFTAEPLGNPIYFLYIFLTVPPCFLCF